MAEPPRLRLGVAYDFRNPAGSPLANAGALRADPRAGRARRPARLRPGLADRAPLRGRRLPARVRAGRGRDRRAHVARADLDRHRAPAVPPPAAPRRGRGRARQPVGRADGARRRHGLRGARVRGLRHPQARARLAHRGGRRNSASGLVRRAGALSRQALRVRRRERLPEAGPARRDPALDGRAVRGGRAARGRAGPESAAAGNRRAHARAVAARAGRARTRRERRAGSASSGRGSSPTTARATGPRSARASATRPSATASGRRARATRSPTSPTPRASRRPGSSATRTTSRASSARSCASTASPTSSPGPRRPACRPRR